MGGLPIADGNRLTLLPEGDCAFDPIVRAIDGATHHVHLMFYIWLTDNSGLRVAEAVERAAHEAAQLAAAQHAAGAPRPVVVAWLRYPAPAPWRVVLDRPAREAGRQLADDLAAWSPAEPDPAPPGRLRARR